MTSLFHWTFLEESLLYDGTQLRSGWVARKTGKRGDGMVLFAGPADVPIANMVDLEDVARNAPIYSEAMLHFIAEFADSDLEKTVCRQRLLMAALESLLKEYTQCSGVQREGDDLYDGPAKLSVSIATRSPVSGLIHAGINIVSKNTPLPTKGLNDYGIPPIPFGKKAAQTFVREMKGVTHAAGKVRPVD